MKKDKNWFYRSVKPFSETKMIEQHLGSKVQMEEAPYLRNKFASAMYLLDQSPLGVLFADHEGKILWANKGVQQMSGFALEELQGQTMRILKSGYHDRSFYEAMWRTIKREGVWQGEVWNRHKRGQIYKQWLRITAIPNLEGEVVEYVSVSYDLTHQEDTKTREVIAYVDGLTGLSSQFQLSQNISETVAKGGHDKHVLILVDIKQFQSYNIQYGYTTGDEILRQVAQGLNRATANAGRAYRFRNDVFAIFLEKVTKSMVDLSLNAVMQEIEQPIQVQGRDLNLTPSFGIAVYPDDGETVDELFMSAEIALKEAKVMENSSVQFSNSNLNERTLRRLMIRDAIKEAIDRDDFEMFYQLIMDDTGTQAKGAEALIRWNHSEIGSIPPMEFINTAEDEGLMVPLGNWIIDRVFRDMQSIIKPYCDQDFYISINLSAKQIEDEAMVRTIGQLAKRHKINPKHVVFEITERVAMRNVQRSREVCAELKRLGFQLALDDFGKGESSLSFLADFDVDIVKVDALFITDAYKVKTKRNLTRALFHLFNQIGVKTVAEGVETQADHDFLKEIHCQNLQGYYFGRPVSFDVFVQRLHNTKLS